MQNKTLRRFAAAVSVDVLRFFDRGERRKRERLRLTALENRRAMRARQHADFAGDLPQILIAAAVHAFLFFENAFAKCLLLHVIERLGDGELVGLRMFFQDRRLDLFAQRFDCLAARDFAFGVKRAFDLIACDLIRDVEQRWIDIQQRHLAFWLADLRREFLLNPNHLARVPMRELERFHEIRFRNFVGRAFNHDDVVFRADINKIEIALFAFDVSRVGDELAIHAADAHGADRSGERNVGNAKRSRRAVDRENVGIVFPIRAEEQADDLGVVEISLRKERPKWPVGHARGERFLFRRAGLRV